MRHWWHLFHRPAGGHQRPPSPSAYLVPETTAIAKDTTPNILTGLDEFHRHFPDPKRVAFLMMRFLEGKPLESIRRTLETLFKAEGITLVRADDYQFADDVWSNVLTFVRGCAFGIAVFEQSQLKEYNPNIALEVGYMLALEKPVCFLKEKTLPSLPADLLDRLYIEYDHSDLPGRLEDRIRKWMRDKGLMVPCRSVLVSFRGSPIDLGQHRIEQIAQGIVSFAEEEGMIRFRGVNCDSDGANCALHFEADSLAAGFLSQNHKRLEQISGLTDLRIVASPAPSEAAAADTNYAYWSELEQSCQCGWQWCLRGAFEGLEQLAAMASSLLPPPTGKIREMAILVTRDRDGIWYFQSNYQPRGTFHPVKLMATDPVGLQSVLSFIVGFDHARPVRLDANLLDAHLNHVRYIFDPRILPSDQKRLPLDSGGARHVEILPEPLSW